MSIKFRPWDWERAETAWLLSDLRQYLDTMELSLQNTKQLEYSALQISRPKYEDEVEWDTMWREHCNSFEDDFPTKLRYSFLILLYSYLETRTKSFCKQLLLRRLVTGSEFKKKGDLSHLASVREFFRRYECLADEISPLWSPLLDFERVRNCIVHVNGVISDAKPKDRSEITGYIERTEGISRGARGEIRIEFAYSKNLIASVKRFFDTCFDAAGFCPKHD